MLAFKKGLKGVIFDCDGVIIDSTSSNRAFYNLVLEHYGLPPMTPEQEKYAFMATSAQALLHILPERLHSELPEIGRKVVNYRKKILPLIKIFPGFLDFVGYLHQHNIKMAILTNRTEPGLNSVLDFFTLPPYFDPVVTASLGEPKPHPGGALHILSTWGVEAEQVAYIGDSDIDKQTAAAAGIPFIALVHALDEDALTGDLQASCYATIKANLAPFLDCK